MTTGSPDYSHEGPLTPRDASGSHNPRSTAVALTPIGHSNRQRDIDWNTTQSETLSGALRYGVFFLRRNWKLMVFGAVAGIMLMPAALFVAPPNFVATATMMFDTGKLRIFQQPSMLESSDVLDDQIQIIESDMIARKVLAKLGPIAEDEFRVPEKGRVERVFGPSIASMLGLKKPRTDVWRDQFRISAFQSGLKVRRIPNTRAIQISYQSNIADRAAHIANLVAATHLDSQIDDTRSLSRRTVGWLQERLDELKRQTADAQRAVNAFRASNSMLEGTGHQFVETRFAEINGQLAAERTKLSELVARLGRVEGVIREYAGATTKPALSELRNNALVSKLREQLYELSNRKLSLLQKYRPSHEAIRQIDQRVKEIHGALLHEHERLAEAYRSDIQIARSKEALLNASMQKIVVQLQSAHKARIRLRELESKAQATSVLYDNLLKRHSEASEQETFPIARGRMLNLAVAPLSKEYKKTTKLSLILLMLGIGMGCGAALLRDLSDHTFRSLHEVEDVLEMPMLSVVPIWHRQTAFPGFRHKKEASSSPNSGLINRQQNVVWVSDDAPQSQFAESLRILKHQIDDRMIRAGGKIIGMTSSQPSEGSSTLAAALAVTMATSGYRTLLIDCDLRNPTLTRLLTPGATTGLIDILKGNATITDGLRTDPATGLCFLPVPFANGERSDQLLAYESMDRLISAARAKFDCVIVDLPSLVPLVDVMVAARFIDGFISVVAWGVSEKESTRRAYEHTPQFRDRLIGVVLNKVDMKRLHHYDYAASQWFDARRYHKYLNLKPA